MPVMPDHWIRRMATEQAMIEPFLDRQQRTGVISYGLSSYGYDARVADEFRVFTNVDSAVVDPKDVQPRTASSDRRGATWPPSRPTASRWRTRSSTSASRATCWWSASASRTYARCGIIVNVTPLEPEWEGQVTIEISNTTPAAGPHLCRRGDLPVPVPGGARSPCETSYADKAGKYMRQRGVSSAADVAAYATSMDRIRIRIRGGRPLHWRDRASAAPRTPPCR